MHLRDLPLLVDDVRDALRVFVFRAARRAVRDPDLAVGVAQQRKREIVLFRELCVVGDRVEADAEELDVLVVVLVGEVPEPGTFCRSPGCVGLRIKPEHDLFAAEVAELRAFSVMVGHFEIRGVVADFQHGRASSDLLPHEAKRAGE